MKNVLKYVFLGTALFDSVVENLEAEQLNQLKTISSQVKDLSEILNELKNSNAISLKEGALELGKRQQVTSHIAMVCILFQGFFLFHCCSDHCQERFIMCLLSPCSSVKVKNIIYCTFFHTLVFVLDF